jgi:hypothetical protein
MLQSIGENSKNNNPSSQKTTKKIPTKTTSEPPDKRDLAEKIVSNVDKIISGIAAKNQ